MHAPKMDKRVNKILFVWPDSNPSTMEKIHLMINGLAKGGNEVSALGFINSNKHIEYYEDAFKEKALYEYQYGQVIEYMKGSNYLHKIVNNLRIMIVFLYRLAGMVRHKNINKIIYHPQPFELVLPVILVGKLFRIDVVPNIMEYYPALPGYCSKKNILKRWAWALVKRFSDGYIVISDYLKDKLLAAGKPILKVPAILESESVITEFKVDSLPCDKPVLLYSGSKEYSDLLEFTLNALSKIRNENYCLIITGAYTDNEKNHWLEMANELGVSGSVEFSGFLSDVELENLQKSSRVLLIPLLDNERHVARFPQKILSYMSLNKPIVTTNVGEMKNYFEDKLNACIDMTNSVDGYAKVIEYALHNPEEVKKIGACASKLVKGKFTDRYWGEKIAGFLDVL